MLSQDKLVLFKVSEPDQEHVRPGPARESRRFRVEEEDVLPCGRRIAFQAEVRDEECIARSPSDDLEREIVECDAPLAHLKGCRRQSDGGPAMGHSATSACAQRAWRVVRLGFAFAGCLACGLRPRRSSQQRGAECP
jgi:hypothetical protein